MLSITGLEIAYLAVAFVLTLIFWAVAFNKLLAVSMHGTLAKSRGIKVKLMEYIFVVLVAVIVTLSIKCIGVLLINALLIIPVAAARNISVNMREYHWFAIIFSMFSGLAGLITSYYVSAATGPMIVIYASIIYFATFVYGRLSR